MQCNSILNGTEGLLMPTEVRQLGGEVVEGYGEIFVEGSGVHLSQCVTQCNSTLNGTEGLLMPTKVRQLGGEVVEGYGELMGEDNGVLLS